MKVQSHLGLRNCKYNFQKYGTFGNISPKSVFDGFYIEKNAIDCALKELQVINFNKENVKKLKRIGIKPVFNTGAEAVQFAKDNNIQIVFDKVDDERIHAQWSKYQNKIIINKKYQKTKNIGEILAISSAILHELAHAKDNDYISSIQEELDCLAMNALAHIAFSEKYKGVFLGTKSPIIKDGVELYANLYFTENQENLLKRVSEKYGDLPLNSPNHEETHFARDIKAYYLKTNK